MNAYDAWLQAPYDRLADAADRFLRREEGHRKAQELDCTDAVHDADENRVTRTLIEIGNRARWLDSNGDSDDKAEFVNEVCSMIDTLIRAYATEQAEHDIERGDDDEHPKPRRDRWITTI